MTERRPSKRWHPLRECGATLLVGLSIAAALAPFKVDAQVVPASAASAVAVRPSMPMTPGTGVTWSTLKPSEQAALKPLQADWASIDELRKSKWLKIAERYPAMSASDQARLHARMAEWAKMSPQDRAKVRVHFLEAKSIHGTDRQADWDAYQALSPEERKALAARATPAPRAASKPAVPTSRAARRDAPQAKPATAAPVAPAATPSVQPVAPSLVQGKPGATTSLITKRPAPPPYQTTATPKIAASADVVDKKTLLPRAGAQKAVAGSSAVPVSGTQPNGPPAARARPEATSASATRQ